MLRAFTQTEGEGTMTQTPWTHPFSTQAPPTQAPSTQTPWVRFFPSDWLGGTRGMSALESGVYITLIAAMYERRAPLPEEAARLARACGASRAQFEKALGVLIKQGKLCRTPQGLWNRRVARELQFTQEKSAAARDAANTRWGKKHNKNNSDDDASALHGQTICSANQKPQPEKQAPSPYKKAARLSDDFIANFQVAEAAGFNQQQAEALFKNFQNYWLNQNGERALKQDWQATWRNWVHSPYAQKFREGNPHAKQQKQHAPTPQQRTSQPAACFADDVGSHMRAFAARYSVGSADTAHDERLSQPLSSGDETESR